MTRSSGRPSLLVPGGVAGRLVRADACLLLAVYVVAFALRWGLRDAQPYTAEATHFFVARGLWDATSNIRYLDGLGGHDDYSWFFWQRPLLTLPFWPAAQHSFAAYRAAHIVLVSAVPALGAWVLRSLGTGRLPAFAAAAALAVHPLLLPWGVLVLPDSLVLGLVLVALLLAHAGRPAATALVLLAASWVKEVAFVTSLTLLVLALWRDADGRGLATRNLVPGRFARWLAPVVPLAFLPLAVSLQVPGAVFPGLRPGGDPHLMYETLWGLVYLAPLPLLALASRRTRRFALVALAWPAFFLVYHYTQGKAIESWYVVLPASFTLLAAAAGLSALWRARLPRPARAAAPILGVAVGCLLAIQVALPDAHPWNHHVATPLSERGQWSLEQTIASEQARDDDLAALLGVPAAHERRLWVAQDVDWSLIQYPVASQAHEVIKVYSVDAGIPEGHLRAWAQGIETGWDATLVFQRDDIAGNLATRLAYQECSTTVGRYTLILAARCQGAGADIVERYQDALHAG